MLYFNVRMVDLSMGQGYVGSGVCTLGQFRFSMLIFVTPGLKREGIYSSESRRNLRTFGVG